MKRPWLIGAVALGVVIIVVAVIAVVGVVGDQPTAQPDRVEYPVNRELIKRARPDPACTKLPRAKPSGSGEVQLSVIRLRGHCLVSETVLVAEAETAARLAELRKQQDVVAADLAKAAAQPPFEDYEGGDGRQFEQAARDKLGGDRLLELWPEDGPEVRVAMIDAGVDATHPELAGRVVATRDTVLGTDGSRDHGTFSAGIVAAAADGQGITGISPKVRLLDAQYYRDAGGWGVNEGVNQPGIADEIIWSVDTGAQVLSVSATQIEGSSTLTAAYAYAELNNVVAIAAVGNCGREDEDKRDDYCRRRDDVMAQADQPTVLGVGATADGKKADYSSINRTVQLVAHGGSFGGDFNFPLSKGDSLLSTCVNDQGRPRTLCRSTGTSFAEPQVAAAAAILVARHPDAAPADIRNALIMSTNRDDLDLEPGQRNDKYGYGRLDILAAAKYLDDHPPQPEPEPEPPVIMAAARIGDKVELILNSGKKLTMQQIAQGRTPGFAFSADGAWFAIADGKALITMNVESGRQRSVECVCSGVAFNADNEVVTRTGSAGTIQIDRYDPETARWKGTTHAQNLRGEIGTSRVVGVAADLTLVAVTGIGHSNRQTILGIGPDGSTITLTGESAQIGRFAVSDDGRWLALSAVDPCVEGVPIRVTDIKATRTSRPAVIREQGLELEGSMSCSVSSLRFSGDELWVGYNVHERPAREHCEPQQEFPQVIPMIWKVAMSSLKFQSEKDPLPWQDVACDRTGQWPLVDGEELYLVEKSRSKESGRAALSHTLFRGGLPQGRDDVQLADDVLDLVVRPHGTPPTPVPPSTAPPSTAPPSTAPPTSAGPPPSERDENRRAGGATPEDAFERMFHAIGDEDYTLACRYITTGQKLGSDPTEAANCRMLLAGIYSSVPADVRAALRKADATGATVIGDTATITPKQIQPPKLLEDDGSGGGGGGNGVLTFKLVNGRWYLLLN